MLFFFLFSSENSINLPKRKEELLRFAILAIHCATRTFQFTQFWRLVDGTNKFRDTQTYIADCRHISLGVFFNNNKKYPNNLGVWKS